MPSKPKLYPWEEHFVNSILQAREFKIIAVGRQTGKSTVAAAYKRLMDDLLNRPVEELLLSERKVHGVGYYTVEPIGGGWLEMESWATATYGDPGNFWSNLDFAPTPARWFMNDRRFWFKDIKDRDWFILRWSNAG